MPAKILITIKMLSMQDTTANYYILVELMAYKKVSHYKVMLRIL